MDDMAHASAPLARRLLQFVPNITAKTKSPSLLSIRTGALVSSVLSFKEIDGASMTLSPEHSVSVELTLLPLQHPFALERR